MPKMYTIDEQLAPMTYEQLEELKQELIAQRNQPSPNQPSVGEAVAKGGARLAQGFGEGALLGLQGRPISEMSTGKTDKYAELLRMEQLKNEIDPSRKMSQMELDEMKRKQAGQVGTPEQTGTTQPTEAMSVSRETTESPEMFIEKPKGKNKYGIMEYETVDNPAYKRWEDQQKEEMKAKVKGEAKAGEASQKALGNFGRIASAIKLYADYYGEALKEGGVGSLHGKYIGQAKLKLGGGIGETVPATGKLYGQGVEMSLASIPIMTGQNRFVESLREAIKGTYPQGQEGPKLAGSLLEQTLINMYMTSKVLSRLGIDIENPNAGDDLSDEDTAQILQEAGYNPQTKKWTASNIYQLDESEKKELDTVKKDILSGLTGKSSQEDEYTQYLKAIGN